VGAHVADVLNKEGIGVLVCQSAFKFDPGSASNFDPFERRVLTSARINSLSLAGLA
jgi:hypothetical protein